MNEKIKIYKEHTDEKLQKKLHLSSGSELALGYDIYNVRKYKQNAFKPKLPWIDCNDMEYNILISEDKTISPNKGVSLISLSDELIQLFGEVDMRVDFQTSKDQEADYVKFVR